MNNKISIFSLFNKLDHCNIGLENFALLDSNKFEKHVIVLKQCQEEAEDFISEVYPKSNIKVYGLQKFVSGFSFRGFLDLLKLIKKLRPAVLHAHHTLAAFEGVFCCITGQPKSIITVHSNFLYYNLIQKIIYGLSFLLSDKIVCNSQNTCNNLSHFLHKKKYIIYNGVDFKKIDNVMKNTEKAEYGLTIGTVCRMVSAKDLQTLIYGFVKLLKMSGIRNVKLTLVGDGPERKKLLKLVKEQGLTEQVRFTGMLSRSSVYKELKQMDIFVVSSRWEGFCNAMVEAAGAGKAVIASNIQPLPEVIGKDNAYFFEVGDSDGLALQLHKLASDTKKRQELGSKARDFVRSRYSLERSVREYEKLYKKISN